VRATQRVAADRRGESVRITLDRGAGVAVRVLDANGRAASCWALTVLAADGASEVAALDQVARGTWCGRLPTGRWRVRANQLDTITEHDIEVVRGAAGPLTIRLPR
jgi:hypothetical protein